MTLEQAQAEFEAAVEAHEVAKRGLRNQRFAAQNRMPHSLAFAEMVEYTARQNWLRSYKNLTALQPPPAPKPVTAPPQSTPKPVVAAIIAKPAPAPPAAVSDVTARENEIIRLRAEHDALSAAMEASANRQHEASQALYKARRAEADAAIAKRMGRS